jgi:hypothetical protein
MNRLLKRQRDAAAMPPPPPRKVQLIEASEAAQLLDEQAPAIKEERASEGAVVPAAQEFSAAERAVMRKQKEEKHLYGRRHQILLQWVLLGKLATLSLANTVLAESASDLSRWNKH